MATGVVGGGGANVIAADADKVESATLAAVMVTVSPLDIFTGAVYKPEVLTEPAPTGLIVHFTAALFVLFTFAVNCCDWLA